MSAADDAKIAAIADAIRIARELSTAVHKAEELGAVLDLEVKTIKVGRQHSSR